MNNIHAFVNTSKRMWELAGSPAAYSMFYDSPVSATRVHVVTAFAEPTQVVVGSSWVVVDPASAQYLKCLKLLSLDSPASSGVAGAIPGLQQSWVLVTNQREVFLTPDEYSAEFGTGPKGDKGDQGDPGPKGEQGDPGDDVVDYDPIIQEAINRYNGN